MKAKCFAALAMTLCCLLLASAHGKITVQGTPAQRTKIAGWLTKSLGATVTIDGSGVVSIAAGGNAAATRLRNMIGDAATSVTIEVVNDESNISIGGWQSSVAGNRYGASTGTQKVDIADLENFGNVLNSYGFTPDTKLMHEITEVYAGVKNGWDYHKSHPEGVKAEREVQRENGTDWVGPRYTHPAGGWTQMKIKRPIGSNPPFVVVRFKSYTQPQEVDWYKEKVPCDLTKGLIAIADPDPQVWLMEYSMEGAHSIVDTIDTLGIVPTGVAYDGDGNLWITDSTGWVWKCDENGDPRTGWGIAGMYGGAYVNPHGIDVDIVTGDVFVTCDSMVARFDSSMDTLGQYRILDLEMRPYDVAIFRGDLHDEDLPRDTGTYDIFVTDRNTGMVARFDVESDMNTGSASGTFGSGFLAAPQGIYVDVWDEIWVASTGNDRVYRFTPLGDVIPGSSGDHFLEYPGRQFSDVIAIDFDGVFVLDQTTGSGELLQYDFFGDLINAFGSGELQCPKSLAVRFESDESNLEALGCCREATGNVNGDPEDAVDISDLTTFVNHLFVTFEPLTCPAEANTNGDAGCAIDISDLTTLVNHLFVTFEPLAECLQQCEF